MVQNLEIRSTRAMYLREYIKAHRRRRRAQLIEMLGVAEALKTQLLCPPCHCEKGVEDRPEPAHSYYRYWYYGCRCAVCRAANAAKSARLREQKAWRLRSSPHT